MIEHDTEAAVSPPSSYQDWLDCFERMRKDPFSAVQDFEAAAAGTFQGTPAMTAALERQLIDTVNALLDRYTRRFIRHLNGCLADGAYEQLDLYFRRLRNDVRRVLFFRSLSFLPEDFRTELYGGVKKQMEDFWQETVGFLRQQSLEAVLSELEDALLVIRRIKLFTE